MVLKSEERGRVYIPMLMLHVQQVERKRNSRPSGTCLTEYLGQDDPHFEGALFEELAGLGIVPEVPTRTINPLPRPQHCGNTSARSCSLGHCFADGHTGTGYEPFPADRRNVAAQNTIFETQLERPPDRPHGLLRVCGEHYGSRLELAWNQSARGQTAHQIFKSVFEISQCMSDCGTGTKPSTPVPRSATAERVPVIGTNIS